MTTPQRPIPPTNWRTLPRDHPERVAVREWEKKYGKKKGDKREKKKSTNDDINIANLDQYILSQHIDKAANYFTSNRNMFNYRTFRQINGNGAQLVNKLRGIDNVDVFYKIKNTVLSLMTPKIRIYKVNYEEYVTNEAGEIELGKTTALNQPCYREFKFSDTFGQESALNVQEYLSYESTKPNWRNVGLKSFSVKQDGRKHGVIENNIDCSLVLTFKSLKDIQASPPGEPSPEKGGLRYVDLITWAPARIDSETDTYNPKHYEIKVLMGYTAPSVSQLRALNLSQQDLNAIKNIEKLNVIVSLSLYNYELKIKENGMVELHGKYRGRLETTIGTNQVNIFQNTFRIKEGGAVEVSKKVNAKHNISNVYKLRTTLNSINRELKKAGCKDEKCKGRVNLRNLVESDQFFKAVFKDAFAPDGKIKEETGIISDGTNLKPKGTGIAMFEFFKDGDNIAKIQAAIKKKVGLYKKDAYKTFVDNLIDGNPQGHGTRLFCINASSEVVTKSTGILVEDSGKNRTAGAEVTEEETETTSTSSAVGVKIDRCHRVDIDTEAVKAEVAKQISQGLDLEGKSKDTKKKKKKKAEDDPARAPVTDFTGKSRKFYFVYLGDIIELACKNAGLGKLDLKPDSNLKNEGYSIFTEESYFPKDERNSSSDYPLKHARVLLGPIEYLDNDGNLKTINLAQFPISFKYFRAWFMKKVVSRQRPQMPLGAFLAALINDLLKPALGVGMPKSFKAPNTNSSIVSLTLPGKQTKTDGEVRTSCGQGVGMYKEALPARQVIDTNSALFEEEYYSLVKDSLESESLLKTSFDYLLLYVTTHRNIIERRGDPAEDVKDGIYHFNIGSDMGLLKSMDFKRVQIPNLVELRSKQAEDQGVDALDQLKFPYDTSLKLIGTSLFTPGMFYYVNPSMAGLGSVEDAGSLAYKMNLGGYHLVQVVTTKITQTAFETEVVGTQTSQGRR